MAIVTSAARRCIQRRSEDTKTLKSAMIDWLLPPSQSLIPSLAPNVKKTARGFNNDVTGALLCPAGVDWSNKEQVKHYVLILSTESFPGLSRGFVQEDLLLPGINGLYFCIKPIDMITMTLGGACCEAKYWSRSAICWIKLDFADIMQAFRHIFTSPSSVEKEAKAARLAARLGNARVHGMIHVTPASLAYAVTQVQVLNYFFSPLLDDIFINRPGLHSHQQHSSFEPILSQILRDSTRLSLTCLKTPTKFVK